jgi:hypothetical protein
MDKPPIWRETKPWEGLSDQLAPSAGVFSL